MSRPVKLTVNNNTGILLELQEKKIENGEFETNPPQSIASTGEWKCDEPWYSFYGTKGYATYKNSEAMVKITFSWEHPHGTAKSSYHVEILEGEDKIRYSIKGSFEGHSQDISFYLDLI